MLYDNEKMINRDDSVLDNEMPWDLIKNYFSDKHLELLARHQLESYNSFTQYEIQKTIEMFNPVVIRSENDYHEESKLHSLEILIEFGNFQLYRPQIHENNGATKLMFPQEARLRNFTYASPMTVDINIEYITRTGLNLEQVKSNKKVISQIHIGKLPIMLKSSICVLNQYKHMHSMETGECRHDPGGYFIINGSEKTVLGQERAAENKVYCFNVQKNNTKWSWMAEIKSVPDYKQISPKQINVMISTKNNGFGNSIHIQIPRIKNPIPIFILFRALNVISDKDICDKIILDIENEKYKEILLFLQASIVDAESYGVTNNDSAIDFIVANVMFTPINMTKENGALKKKEFAIDVLNNDLFPHCRTKEQKVYFLGYMINKVIRAKLGYINQDDRDSYLNKRVDLTGTLLNNLFRNYFNKVVKDLQKQTIKEINNGSWRSTNDYINIINKTNIYKIIKSTTIENGLKRALSTGDFGIKHSTNNSKVGVAQVLNRLTYASTISHSRRISTPIDKSGKLVPPRLLHNTSWGFLCPVETPEGQSVGVVKNLSCLTHITISSESETLYDYLKEHVIPVESVSSNLLDNKVKVFINGCWIGITDKAVSLYSNLKDKKYKGIINIYTSIVFNYKEMEIRICNDAGRLTRPLLKVKNNDLLMTNDIMNNVRNNSLKWNELLTNMKLQESIIEYVDPDEQNASMLAMWPKDLKNKKSSDVRKFYTHCEIHPSTVFGILASCIPFPDHNQSPRNCYQCAQSKQAMGVYATNFDVRMDKTAYILNYPMRPLVDTRVMNIIKINDIPAGSQVIVAIMTHTGYNQEDSILFNKGSVDRGLFQATIYHTEKDEDKKVHGDEEIRCKPDKSKTRGMKFANYNKINNQGVVPENTLLENRDIIISKVVTIKENKNDHTKVIKYEDCSKTYRTHEETYVDKNYIDRNGDGYNFAKVRTRTVRKPVMGDKFCSRHGQKGTVGLIIPEEDMPFTDSGIKPDIIINPHAIPSRMTIGHLKETLLGKVLVHMGLFGDGSSFNELTVDFISNQLQSLGFESYGNEVLYDGNTGEQMDTNIFIGPVFYQRLKHMVSDKQHSRSIGPMVNLTRQPAEGRSRDGGFRIGEMERDCMCSHGAARFTRGRLYDASDKFSVYTCKSCGMIASYNNNIHVHTCKLCGNRTDFGYVELPYSCKLLFQELLSMNVAPRMLLNN